MTINILSSTRPVGRRRVRRTAGLAAAAGAALGTGLAAPVGVAPAAADANTCTGAGIDVSFDCVTVYGNGTWVADANSRAYRHYWNGLPRQVCKYQTRYFGTLPNGSGWQRMSAYNSGCAFSPAWTDPGDVNMHFRSRTWWGAEWKENQVWSGRYVAICLDAWSC
jgi:hypothetical protein